jgi:CheY-like chemotaxis protein
MKTILLVDDDQQVREVFSLALRRNCYYVIKAYSALERLEMAREHLPDLILDESDCGAHLLLLFINSAPAMCLLGS